MKPDLHRTLNGVAGRLHFAPRLRTFVGRLLVTSTSACAPVRTRQGPPMCMPIFSLISAATPDGAAVAGTFFSLC